MGNPNEEPDEPQEYTAPVEEDHAQDVEDTE